MYRKLLTFLVAFFVIMPFCASSQSGRVLYDAVINRSHKDVVKDEMFKDDLYSKGWLLFDRNKAIYHQTLPDSTITARSDGSGELIRNKYQITVSDTIGSVYRIDYNTKEILERIPLYNLKNFYIVKDKLETIQWSIDGEKKRIGTFEVIKANANYLGRNWTAWFAPEIPVSVGPWKLYGLPGLILEAQDSAGKFRFFLKELQIPFSTTTLMFNPQALNKTAISKPEFIKIEQKKKDDQYRFTKARMEAAAGPDSGPVKININFAETIEIYK